MRGKKQNKIDHKMCLTVINSQIAENLNGPKNKLYRLSQNAHFV